MSHLKSPETNKAAALPAAYSHCSAVKLVTVGTVLSVESFTLLVCDTRPAETHITK